STGKLDFCRVAVIDPDRITREDQGVDGTAAPVAFFGTLEECAPSIKTDAAVENGVCGCDQGNREKGDHQPDGPVVVSISFHDRLPFAGVLPSGVYRS